jgi:peptidoglycan/LPS O-acetylase OafA/YrhL
LIGFARRQRVVLLVLASGLALELAAFFVATGRDYRYSYWMICCTCVALVMVIVQRARREAA